MDTTHAPPSDPKGKRALVVDDDLLVSRLIVRILTDLGMEVLATPSPKQAFGIARRSRFDLIVSDFHMPEMDGADLRRAMKSHPATRDVPFLLCSGQRTDKGLSCGATAYLQKPFSREELITCVRTLLGAPPAPAGDSTPRHPGGHSDE